MTFNSAIDVAIGLILMYLVLSLICTTINEFIATQLKLRANTLAAGIKNLIDDPVLHKAFNDHGLVDGAKAALGGTRLPSYVDGRTFAMAILGSLDTGKPIPAIADIEKTLQGMPDSNIRDMLLAQFSTASGDIEKLRDNVATWFDQTMDRVGGIYKKNLKLISLAVGLLVAIAINADSVSVAKALWNDPALRTQISDAAVLTTKPAEGGDPAKALQASIDGMKSLRPLPIGWDTHPGTFPTHRALAWFWMQKVVGFIVTGIALSLGAPFWFDLLSKFMNVRGSGAKPERTQPTS